MNVQAIENGTRVSEIITFEIAKIHQRIDQGLHEAFQREQEFKRIKNYINELKGEIDGIKDNIKSTMTSLDELKKVPEEIKHQTKKMDTKKQKLNETAKHLLLENFSNEDDGEEIEPTNKKVKVSTTKFITKRIDCFEKDLGEKKYSKREAEEL